MLMKNKSFVEGHRFPRRRLRCYSGNLIIADYRFAFGAQKSYQCEIQARLSVLNGFRSGVFLLEDLHEYIAPI